MIKSCKQCGESFETNNKRKMFCNDACRRKYNGKHRGHKQTCKQCGKTFYEYKKRICCSIDCRLEYQKHNKKQKDTFEKVCPCCNNSFTTTKSNKKYCSKDCMYQHYLNRMHDEREQQRIYYQKRCKECGKHFTSTRSTAVFCSDECSNRFENRKQETTRRKRIMKNGRVDWDISIERLIKRDGYNCYLCGEPINLKVDTNNDLYPSIEHVIPVAKGGTHTWDNVKLAHRHCNSIKQDKLL